MRKTFFALALASLLPLMAQAQSADKNIFNQLGATIGVGTPGITLEVATPITDYVQLRAGVDFGWNIKYSTSLDLDAYNGNSYDYDIPQEVDVEGKLKLTTGHLIADVFPFKTSSFHLSAGFYFGGSKVVNVYNTDPKQLADVVAYNELADVNGWEPVGVELGDYLLSPYRVNGGGRVEANIKTNGFRPYLGLGFGKAVPQKHRFGCQFDLGVQFWGSPKIYTVGENGEHELTEKDANGEDGGLIKTISKVSVFPTLSVKFTGRIL